MALRIAARLGASILSVDSMQVYRGMDIGTAKPSPEDRARIPHHMLDLVDPADEYTVAEFQETARRVVEDTEGPVIVVGGSGLHFRAVVDPLEFPPHDPRLRALLEGVDVSELRSELLTADPAAGEHVDLDNPRRVVRAVEVLRLTGRSPSARAASPEARAVAEHRALLPFRAVGIDPGDDLAARVPARFRAMLDRGLLDEVTGLAGRMGRTAAQAVGYKELLGVVDGSKDLASATEDAIGATTSLARRQRTWFRRDPRIHWLTWRPGPDRLADEAMKVLDDASADERQASWSS